MRRYILSILIFFIYTALFSQENNFVDFKTDLNQQVYGVVVSDNIYYLITKDGYLAVPDSSDNFWTAYYKIVYSDSDSYNPNTIIEPENSPDIPLISVFPYISLDNKIDEKWGFNEEILLNSFISVNKYGHLKFFPNIWEIISGTGRTNNISLPENR